MIMQSKPSRLCLSSGAKYDEAYVGRVWCVDVNVPAWSLFDEVLVVKVDDHDHQDSGA
jgi:hypothetical protein